MSTRHKIIITLKSSCKEVQLPTASEMLGEWDYTIDHDGFRVTGTGRASSDQMTAYSAALYGIIDALKSLGAPCAVVVRTTQKAIGQTAAGIKRLGWTPKGRGPWAHPELWKELVQIGIQGGHKIVFEHAK